MNMLENIPLQSVEAIIVNKSPDPMFGARGAAGSIRIQTRKGVNVYDDNESSLLKEIIVRGYSAAVKFYTPKYNAEPSDPRYISYAAIHWVPDIMTDSTGKAAFKFYLPTEIKEIKIRAEGIDNGGKLLFYNRKLSISDSK